MLRKWLQHFSKMEFNVLQSSNSQNSYIFNFIQKPPGWSRFLDFFILIGFTLLWSHQPVWFCLLSATPPLHTRDLDLPGGLVETRMVFCPWPSNSKIRKPFGEDFRRFHSNLCCDLTWGLRRQLQGMCDAPCGAWRKLVCVLDEVAAGRTCWRTWCAMVQALLVINFHILSSTGRASSNDP